MQFGTAQHFDSLRSLSHFNMWFVYILYCENKSFYVGITDNLEKRYRTHKEGRGAKYTRSFTPEAIVYVERCKTKSQALKREIQLKNLSHAEKEKLANGYSKLKKGIGPT